MNISTTPENTVLVRFSAMRRIAPEVFSELIRRKALTNESVIASVSGLGSRWNIGFVSRKGNVRNRNEDYGVAFNYEDHQVLIVGDGLGGPSHGDLASFLAVESASQVVLQHLKHKMSLIELKRLSSVAVWTAGHQLACMGDKLNVVHTGLRTTLILIIARKDLAVMTYIGDGAVYHYKSPTDCPSVLSAHKAIPGNLSLLSASLGPTIHGKLSSRTLDRTESDVIIVMTDGIADRIAIDADSEHPPQLIAGLIRLAQSRAGDLQSAAEESVAMLTEEKDEKGYICDDNVSLGFIGNCQTP